jgi:hypothetical protein
MLEIVAMRISEHGTCEVFERYNIVSKRDLDEAARKIESSPVWARLEHNPAPKTGQQADRIKNDNKPRRFI